MVSVPLRGFGGIQLDIPRRHYIGWEYDDWEEWGFPSPCGDLVVSNYGAFLCRCFQLP